MRFYANPRLLVIDEVGYLPLAQEASAALFQVTPEGTYGVLCASLQTWPWANGPRPSGKTPRSLGRCSTAYCTVRS